MSMLSSALLPAHSVAHIHPHKLRRQEREKFETEKAMKKHLLHLEKPTVKAAIAEAVHSKKGAAKAELTLSNQFPLDKYLANRASLPHIKMNPFTNVHGTQAKANLEKLGLDVVADGSSHFAVRTKPDPLHPHGHRLGTLPVHPHESIPSGTHHAFWDEMNENLIGFLNHADDNVAKLPEKPREAFRHFVAEKLSEAGAKSSTEILPKNILSTKDHKTIKSLHALIENANPDTAFNIWKDR